MITSNLQVRILVSLVYFPIVLLCAWDPLWFELLLSAMGFLFWHEYLCMQSAPKTRSDWFFHILIIAISSLPLWIPLFTETSSRLGYALFALAIVLNLIYRIMNGTHELKDLKQDMGSWVFGLIYLTGTLCLLRETQNSDSGHLAIWFVFFVVGASDTAAYFGGRFFGRKPFFQAISPNKTQEGFYCGIIGALLIASLFYLIFQWLSFGPPSLMACLVLALFVSIFSSFGDLFESMLKRNFKVKDSSQLMPGHGGVLDRFDAVLFGVIPVFVYVAWVGRFGVAVDFFRNSAP